MNRNLPAIFVAVIALALWLRAIPPTIMFKGPGPFSPDQLTNLTLWWNGDHQVINNGNTNNAPVTKYFDKTVNLNHGFTNLSEGGNTIPIVVTNQLNAHAIVRFAGSNYYRIKTNFLSGIRQGEMWFVAKSALDPAGATRYALFGINNTNTTGGGVAYPHPTVPGRYQDDFLSSQTFYELGTAGTFSNQFHVVGVFTKSNEMIISIDGDLIQGGSKIWPGSISNATVGFNANVSTIRWAGDLADLYIFNSQNTERNRFNMLTYLANLYGIALVTNIWAESTRDTNQWALTNFQTGMFFSYCATNFNGLTNNAPIGGTGRFWTDEGPLANHATNATAASQPLFQSNVFGTLPGVRFDGTDDKLHFLTSIALNNTNDFTFLAVHMPTNITTARPIAGVAAGGGGTDIRVNHNTENRLAVRSSVGGVLSVTASGELIPTAALNGAPPVMNVWSRTNGVWKFWGNLQQGFENAAGENRTNRANITIDAIGFTTDFTVGYSGWIYRSICWTNRFINPRDVMNMYRLIFKSEVSVLP